MMPSDILIKGGTVLTLGDRTQNHRTADVLVEGGRITEVGPDLRARMAEVVDASEGIVVPGFVDAHRHAWKALFRNMGMEATPDSIAPWTDIPLEAEDIYAATLISLLGAVEAGITTVVDWADMAATREQVDATIEAHRDSGLRTVLVVTTDAAESSSLQEIVDAVSGGAPSTTVAYASGELSASGGDDLAANWARAREMGLRLHVHVRRGSGGLSAVAGKGLLDADTTLVHCTDLDEGELDAIAASGAGVVLTPASEMTQGFGWPPMQGLIDRNIRPGLGVDDESFSPSDMFAQMRAANSLQHARLFDLKLAGKAGIPNLLSTRDVIRYGTIDGAKAIGLAGSVGSIEAGKAADITVLRTDRPNVHPINDPIGAVVWGMDTSNVDWVIAGGQVLIGEGKPRFDAGRARKLAVAARNRVGTSAGLPAADAGRGAS